MADEFSFNIEETFGVISTSKTGWTTELNKVKWGDHSAKYDIRPWDPEHRKMGKGITFTSEELKALKSLLNEIEIN